jgi:hypothetical protein
VGIHTDIGVLVGHVLLIKRAIDDWDQVGIEALGLVKELGVLGAAEVVVGAELRVIARGSILQPSSVLTPSASCQRINWNQLVSVHGGLDRVSVCQCLHCLSRRRVQALEEALRRALEDIVNGRGD